MDVKHEKLAYIDVLRFHAVEDFVSLVLFDIIINTYYHDILLWPSTSLLPLYIVLIWLNCFAKSISSEYVFSNPGSWCKRQKTCALVMVLVK